MEQHAFRTYRRPTTPTFTNGTGGVADGRSSSEHSPGGFAELSDLEYGYGGRAVTGLPVRPDTPLYDPYGEDDSSLDPFSSAPAHLHVLVDPLENPYHMPLETPSSHTQVELRRVKQSLQCQSVSLSSTLGGKDSGLYLALLLCVWYSSCVVGTVVNKRMMKEVPLPGLLTCVHLFSAGMIDWYVAVKRGHKLEITKQVVLYSLPVAAMLTFTKCLTYVSYSKVPASLTQTVRALAPIFTVVVNKLYTGKLPGMLTILSLIPISGGVTLSAVNEINFNFVGFMCALLATFTGVMQSQYTKSTLTFMKMEPLVFHLWTSFAALLTSVPFAVLGGEIPLLQGLISGGDSTNTDDSDSLIPVDSGSSTTSREVVAMMLLSVATHYLQNLSSIYFLNHVNVLTHTVANTLKRMVIIVGTVMYFRNPISRFNALGMVLSMTGFFCYGLARNATKAGDKGKHKRGSDVRPHAPAHTTPQDPVHHQHHHAVEMTPQKHHTMPGAGKAPARVVVGQASPWGYGGDQSYQGHMMNSPVGTHQWQQRKPPMSMAIGAASKPQVAPPAAQWGLNMTVLADTSHDR